MHCWMTARALLLVLLAQLVRVKVVPAVVFWVVFAIALVPSVIGGVMVVTVGAMLAVVVATVAVAAARLHWRWPRRSPAGLKTSARVHPMSMVNGATFSID